jgi:hypothetical protein
VRFEGLLASTSPEGGSLPDKLAGPIRRYRVKRVYGFPVPFPPIQFGFAFVACSLPFTFSPRSLAFASRIIAYRGNGDSTVSCALNPLGLLLARIG